MSTNTNEENSENIPDGVIWETEFFAISVLTGEMKKYRGMFIHAESIQHAMSAIRMMKLDYLQLTGQWFKSYEHVKMDDEFYKKLTHPMNIVGDMNYDEFVDWLDLALSEDDLLAARREFEKIPELKEHIKIIDAQIKLRYDNKKEESNQTSNEKTDQGEASGEVEESND